MKRQWWEVSAGPEPLQACEIMVGVNQTSKSDLPLLRHDFPTFVPQPCTPEHTTRTSKTPESERTARTPRTPMTGPAQQEDPEFPDRSEDEDQFDHDTRMCLSRALKVEPKYVCCEAFAYSLMCKHSRGHAILPSQLAELWDLMPNTFKYSDGDGKYTVLGANPRKHDAVTGPTDALPHSVRLCAAYVRQTHPHFEFSTLSFRLNMQTKPHRDTRNGTNFSYIHSLEPTQGGELWLAHPQGSIPLQHNEATVLGKVVDVHTNPHVFDARGTLHATMPWQGKRRLVLVAFTTLHSRCPSPLSSKLLDLGIYLTLGSETTKQTTLRPFLMVRNRDSSGPPKQKDSAAAPVVEVDSLPSEAEFSPNKK